MASNSKNLMTMAAVVIIALLGLNVYQYFSAEQSRSQATKYKAQATELKIAKEQLNKTYQGSITKLNEMKSDNVELNNLIEKQKEKLRIQKQKVSDYLYQRKELAKAKEELQILSDQANSYIAEVRRLRKENAQLKDKNNQLTSVNNELTNDNIVLTQTIQQERGAKNQAIQEKNQAEARANVLQDENVQLNSKVDLASAIKVKYTKIQGYKVSDSGKRKKKSRAKDINTIQMCFVTGANDLVKSDEQRFYFRIISPLGETVVDEMGSGVLTNKADGSKVRYTKSGTIKYEGKPTTACLDWKTTRKLEKGEYQLEIYSNGFLVNESKFKLK